LARHLHIDNYMKPTQTIDRQKENKMKKLLTIIIVLVTILLVSEYVYAYHCKTVCYEDFMGRIICDERCY
jgi:hypothetical protein